MGVQNILKSIVMILLVTIVHPTSSVPFGWINNMFTPSPSSSSLSPLRIPYVVNRLLRLGHMERSKPLLRTKVLSGGGFTLQPANLNVGQNALKESVCVDTKLVRCHEPNDEYFHSVVKGIGQETSKRTVYNHHVYNRRGRRKRSSKKAGKGHQDDDGDDDNPSPSPAPEQPKAKESLLAKARKAVKDQLKTYVDHGLIGGLASGLQGESFHTNLGSAKNKSVQLTKEVGSALDSSKTQNAEIAQKDMLSFILKEANEEMQKRGKSLEEMIRPDANEIFTALTIRPGMTVVVEEGAMLHRFPDENQPGPPYIYLPKKGGYILMERDQIEQTFGPKKVTIGEVEKYSDGNFGLVPMLGDTLGGVGHGLGTLVHSAAKPKG